VDEDQPTRDRLRSLRTWYPVKVLANAVDETDQLMPRGPKLVAALATPAVAVFVGLTIVGTQDPAKASGVVENVAIAVATSIVLGLLIFALNVLLAPARMQRAADEAADCARLERDQAQAALEEREAATKVTIEVIVVADGPLRTLDVGPEVTESWLAEQRRKLGDPHTTPEPPRVGRIRIIGALAETRSPGEFTAEVAAWMDKARPAARAELLRLATVPAIALLRVYARNTGVRQLSDVRVTLRMPIDGRASWEDYHLKRRFPDPPRSWGAWAGFPTQSTYLEVFNVQAATKDRSILEGNGEIRIEFEPVVLPSGANEYLDTLHLGIPGDLAGGEVELEYQVTAREAEGSADGSMRVAIAPDPLSVTDLEHVTEAWNERLTRE
jgi:hypothetical protein